MDPHGTGIHRWSFFRGVSGPSSSCVWNPRVFADDARAHTWAQVDTVLRLSCSPYRSEPGTLAGTTPEPSGPLPLLPGVEAKHWEEIEEFTVQSDSLGRYCLEQLHLQRMKNTLLQASFQSEEALCALRRDATYILGSGYQNLCESGFPREAESVGATEGGQR